MSESINSGILRILVMSEARMSMLAYYNIARVNLEDV